VIFDPGLHSDAIRLSLQRRRARYFSKVVAAIDSGTPLDALTHPAADAP
jgi:hypothetical protein